MVRLCLRVLLSISIALSSLSTYAQPTKTNKEPIAASEKPFLNSIDLDKIHEYEDITEADRVALRALYQEPARVALEMLTLVKALNEEVATLEESLGREEFLKVILDPKARKAIDIEIEGIGKAQLKAIGEKDRTR